METTKTKLISIIIPTYQGESYIKELVERIDKVRDNLYLYDVNISEIIFVCDEPIDESTSLLQQLKSIYNYIRILELGFNVGQHLATAAGILSANGDWVITMDEDLQHPPELIPHLLYIAFQGTYDLVYSKSILETHKNSYYRDQASRAAKLIASSLTGLDIRNISSYRCIRGQLARCCASSIDQFQYLDSLLQFMTSKTRRFTEYAEISDTRTEKSGYTFPKLMKHFSRLLISSLVSGSRLFFLLIMPFLLIIASALAMFAGAYISNTAFFAPGWMSMFAMQIMQSILLALTIAIIVKVSGILMLRSIAPPNFLIADRDDDGYWEDKLKDFA